MDVLALRSTMHALGFSGQSIADMIIAADRAGGFASLVEERPGRTVHASVSRHGRAYDFEFATYGPAHRCGVACHGDSQSAYVLAH